MAFLFFFFQCYGAPRDLHSFPTRRSSDLWAFRAPRPVAVPSVRHAGRVRNPIDAFILAKLEAKGLTLAAEDRKSTRLNSSHITISYAVFCLKKKNKIHINSGVAYMRKRND